MEDGRGGSSLSILATAKRMFTSLQNILFSPLCKKKYTVQHLYFNFLQIAVFDKFKFCEYAVEAGNVAKCQNFH